MLERKLQIYKIRVANLMDEHADALAQAQDVHSKLQEAQQKILKLEEDLRNKDVQKENTDAVVATKKQDKVS